MPLLQQGMTYKMLVAKIYKSMMLIIESILEDRQIFVSLKDSISTARCPTAGVPQG